MAQYALVVEDDTGTSYVFQELLKSLGFTVICARDGATALEYMRQQSYDVVFMDLLLPRVSGFELLAHRDQLDHLRDCPVVVVTAHSRMKDDLPLGPRDRFLVKPVPLRDLCDTVCDMLPCC